MSKKKVKKGNEKGEKGVILHNNGGKVVRNDRQIRIIRQTIEGLINTPSKRECAKYLKISENSLYKRLRRYSEIQQGVERFIESVKEDSRRRIVFETPKAVDKVVNLIDNAKSEQVQLQASQDILDRAGIIKPSNTNIQVNVLNQLKKDGEEYQ